MKIVNATLLRNPLNWLIIWSMLLVGFYLAHLLISFFSGVHPGINQQGGMIDADVAGPGTESVPGAA